MPAFSRTRLLYVVLAAASAIGLVLLAPSSLGGSATWVSTSGDSMQPDIHAGDLVIARPEADYQVGDVVAYPSATLDGTVVLHRIVADKPDGFVTRGDNNDWLDPDRPQTAEILGEMWLHIPGGGRVLTVLASPFFIAALVLTLLTAGALFTARRTRRRGSRRAHGTDARTARTPATTWPTREWAAGTAVGAVALGVVAFGQPVNAAASDEIAVTHVAKLSYSAPVDTAGIYADDRVRTGDPVFLSVAPAVDTHLDYRLDTPSDDITGTVRTTARLSATNGWHSTVALGDTAPFRGSHAERTVTVDLPRLLRMVQRAERQAGTTFGGYTVEITHDIAVEGQAAGRPVDTTYRPKLTFTLDAVQAIPQNAGNNTGALTLTQDSTTTVPTTAPATVTALRWDIPVSILRALTITLAAISLVLAMAALRRRNGAPEPGQVFGRRLVRASNLDLGDRPVIDVEDPAALLRLATLYDTVVVELARPTGQVFFVTADNTLYRYTRALTEPSGWTEHGKYAAGAAPRT